MPGLKEYSIIRNSKRGKISHGRIRDSGTALTLTFFANMNHGYGQEVLQLIAAIRTKREEMGYTLGDIGYKNKK